MKQEESKNKASVFMLSALGEMCEGFNEKVFIPFNATLVPLR